MSFKVLKRGSRGAEVKWLKGWLNVLVSPSPGLAIAKKDFDNQFDDAAANAVMRFQLAHNLFASTGGVVDAHTVTEIWKQIAPSAWLHNTSVAGGPLRFDRSVFFEHCLVQLSKIDAAAIRGLGVLLGFIEWDDKITDLRWAAYMLATVRFECGPDFKPRAESDCIDGRTPVCSPIPGNTRSYGDPKDCPNLKLKPPVPCPAGKTNHTYYGRGYVQITTRDNYANMSQELFGDDQLVHFPERVLEPSTAYQIMSPGMRKGLFRAPNNLEKFIKPFQPPKYTEAREIINGKKRKTDTFADNAEAIAAFAVKMEAILRASRVQASTLNWNSLPPPQSLPAVANPAPSPFPIPMPLGPF